MNNAPKSDLPRDAAQLVLWFKGLKDPTVFVVAEVDAQNSLDAFNKGNEFVTFKSYPFMNAGVRSESLFLSSDLRGITIEVPTIKMVGL